MGALADFFVATPSAAKQYGVSSLIKSKAHRRKYGQFSARGLTALELSYLWSILGEERWNDEHHKLELCSSDEINLKQWLESMGGVKGVCGAVLNGLGRTKARLVDARARLRASDFRKNT